MRSKLSLAGDVCMPHPILLSLHDAPCVEAPTPILWPPGFALQQNKLTRTVFHKGQLMALAGHDCGHWIPHMWVPPWPPLPILIKLPLIIVGSQRKMLFSSSTVKADDSQIACSQLLGGMLLPMRTCGSPFAFPTSSTLLNFLHSVSVNMTIGDLVAGFLDIALNLALAVIFGKMIPGPKKEEAKESWGDKLMEFSRKTAIGVLVSGARIATTREGELKIDVGPAYLKAGASVGIKRDGTLGISASGQVFTGRGVGQFKVSHTNLGGGKSIRNISATLATSQRMLGYSTSETFEGGAQVDSKTEAWGVSL